MAAKRGRPRGKKLSAAEVAQRRAAPTKHGMRASGPSKGMTPCKQATCPLHWKCDVRQHRDRLELGTDACVAFLPQPHEVAVAARAVALKMFDGDAQGYRELVAESYGKLQAILDTRAAQVLCDGVTAQDIDALTGLANLLGVSADAQKWTPRSQGTKLPGLRDILDLARGGRKGASE